MCVVSVTKSCWAEVQQLWVPACLFCKHRFRIDTEWSIFPKTVQIHLINFTTKEILLFFTTAYRDFSMGSFLQSWIHIKKHGFYLEQCHFWTICYTYQSLKSFKSFSHCKLKRCLHWEGCQLWVFFHSHKQTHIRYWINTITKYLFILPHTHYNSQKCLQCIVANIRPNTDKIMWKTLSHWKTLGEIRASWCLKFCNIFFKSNTSRYFGRWSITQIFWKMEKNLPRGPLQIEILTLE